ncbi:alpha-glucosidase/alpha-galactosidase [bacterium]|nr:alpha-glucosidase/alpha-galactosidase [bacterium]
MREKNLKIMVIGAGSASFGLSTLSDFFQSPLMKGAELILCDIDEVKLQLMTKLALRLNEASGLGAKVRATTNYGEDLDGADFVITSVERKRMTSWKLDWEIPQRFGVKQVLGENGGPGGMFHAFRTIPILLDIAKSMEEKCPNAWLINFSNPLHCNMLAIYRYSKIKAIGLCHGLRGVLHQLADVMGVPFDSLSATAGGFNHFTWIKELTFKENGKDAYPLLKERLASLPEPPQPLSYLLFQKLGLYPSPGDNHIGEYLPNSLVEECYPWETTRDTFWRFNFEADEEGRKRLSSLINRIVEGEENPQVLLQHRSGERAIDIIEAMLEDKKELEIAVNIPNKGYIENLPDGIVEVPATVGKDGPQGLKIGKLPIAIASLCHRQMDIQELVVESAVKGSRELAIQAMLIDPVVPDSRTAEQVFDALLEAHRDLLPTFQ